MTRESKAGLLMIVMLVGVFGFMVFKKVHRPIEAKAQQDAGLVDRRESADADRTTSDQEADESEEFAPPVVERPKTNNSRTKVVAAKVSRRTEEETIVQTEQDDAREIDPFATRQPPRKQTKANSIVQAASDSSDFVDQLPQDPPVGRRESLRSSVDDVDTRQSQASAPDPFSSVESPPAEDATVADLPVSRVDARDAAFDRLETSAEPTDDPVRTKPTESEAPKRGAKSRQIAAAQIEFQPSSQQTQGNDLAESVPEDPFAPPQVQTPPLASPPPLAERASARDSFSEPTEQPEPLRSVSEPPRLRAATRDESRPANRRVPSARIDEDFAPRSAPQPLVAGTTYQIEANDNFWTISRKKYGTGRYFMALAQHNVKIIPDPQRMQPGVVIATPASEVLDRGYPQLISKPAAANSSPTQPAASASASTGVTRTSAQRTIAGDSYQIEPNDNFWTISRKKYGTGSYFMALAHHNVQTIPDPQNMRPGVVVSTPSADALERAYPHLIPNRAAAGNSDGIRTASATNVEVNEQSSFYVGTDGTPMYRVGAGDTLGSIAQRHLGRSSRYIQIYHLNRDILTDEKTLRIGMELRLPADASRVEVVGDGRTYR